MKYRKVYNKTDYVLDRAIKFLLAVVIPDNPPSHFIRWCNIICKYESLIRQFINVFNYLTINIVYIKLIYYEYVYNISCNTNNAKFPHH